MHDEHHPRFNLKIFLIASILAGSLLTFLATYFITSSNFKKLFRQQAGEAARGISGQIIETLPLLMEKGWSRQELEAFLQPLLDTHHDLPAAVSLYRSRAVEELFGSEGDELPGDDVLGVAASGQPFTREEGERVVRVVPLVAAESCLGCHANVTAGTVLGVFRIEFDLSGPLREITRKSLLLLLALSFLPVLLAALIARFVTFKIDRSVASLQEAVEGVNHIRDLAKIEDRSSRSEFRELDRILSEFNHFAAKVREIAIDKELLEFEVKLLESFIITSDVVMDWKDHVGKLLRQVNEIMDAYALFSIFQVGDETYDLDIFWRSTPSPATRAHFDEIVRRRVGEHSRLAVLSQLKVNHNVVDYGLPEIALEPHQVELQTKSILLESPQVGGVVGIGVHSLVDDEPGRSLVIDSILTNLINVIGSIKAIYKHTKEVEYYATRDPLTNLHNQRVFWDLATNELCRARRHAGHFALLMIDFDNFKMVNDRYGYAFGDSFLQYYAGVVKSALRDGDILTRYGGDEFAAILPEADHGQAFSVADRIMNCLRETATTAPDGKKIKATVSMGFAVFPDHADDVQPLFALASNMMLKAKKEGKGRIAMPAADDIVELLRSREEKSLFLLNVIEEKHQVIPFFQPIMDVSDGSMPMHELLMGIEHGGRILPASEFIDDAEQMGIVSQLDFIVIEKAFEKVREVNYQGLLFINLSPRSLVLGEFILTITKLAARFGIEPARIVFEITERETVRNRVLLDRFVKDLKMAGFKFAIDDFGAGFSTFYYIKLFPADYIKIEGDFIRNAPSDATDRAFVRCIISLARDLGIKTIAEQIESEEILATVRELGVDYGQGYFVRRPSTELT